jgi:hypothetical protein
LQHAAQYGPPRELARAGRHVPQMSLGRASATNLSRAIQIFAAIYAPPPASDARPGTGESDRRSGPSFACAGFATRAVAAPAAAAAAG